MTKLFRFILPLLMLTALTAHAERVDSLVWHADLTAAVGGGEHSPFWFANNTYGQGSIEPNNVRLTAGIFKPMRRDSRWSWGAGLELTGGVRQQMPFHIQQAYGEIRYRCLDAMIGQKQIPGAISNPRLSSGNLLFSTNAMPIPQIRLGIFDYADVWGTRGWLGVKGYLSYGMFTDSRWLRNWVDDGVYPQNVLYHSKGLWLRNGNTDKFPLQFEAGIEMATQFGGSAYYRTNDGQIAYTKNPSGLKAFWKALVPLEGDDSTIAGEKTNIQGNFIGNWTFALSWNPKADWNVKLYYQHMFEDHSMLYIEYPWKDGLYGIEAKLPRNRWVSRVVYEFLYTKDQTGPVYWDKTDKIPVQISGRDQYYFHSIYGAWQNWGRIIGNPLIISPIYSDHTLSLLSSRLWAHHVGFEGEPTDDISYRVLLTFSRNWGTYSNPLPEVADNFNFLAEVKWAPSNIPALRGWEGTVGLGADGGSLLGRSVGLQISIAKRGLIRF